MAKKNEKTEQKAVNLTIDNYISILREQSEQDELQAMEIASNYIDLYEQPEQTLTGIKREYKAKLLPLVLYETEDGKQLVGIAGDPELNPTAPEYDSTRLQDELLKMRDEIRRVDDLLTLQRVNTAHRIANAAEKATEIKANDAKDDIVGILRNIGQWARDNLPGIDWDLLPYIAAEMDKAESAGIINTHEPIDATAPEWVELIDNARTEKARAELVNLPQIDGDKVEKIHTTTDKVNRELWESATAAYNNQITLNTQMTEQAGALVTTTINFDNLPEDVQRKLSHYDRRVFTAAISLINIKCRCVTPEHVLFAMGYQGKPAKSQLDAVTKSIFKLDKILVTIDNTALSRATQGKYPAFITRGTFHLLPVDFVEAINPATGKVVKTAFVLPQDEPILMKFARVHKQITTFSRGVYLAPLSKTENTMRLEDYLIEQIAWMRNNPKKRNNKILLSTVCDTLNITSRMEKARTEEKIIILLDHFKTPAAQYFIADYEHDEKAHEFIITLDRTEQ